MLSEFKNKYEEMLMDKTKGPEVLGKYINVLTYDEKEGMSFNTSSLNPEFIHEMKRLQ